MAFPKGAGLKKPSPKASLIDAPGKPRTQYGALPFRLTCEIEFLLVTSRETGRWVIPKGWPMSGKTRREAAAQEALEEAGVVGKVVRGPLGSYDYVKYLKTGEGIACRVTVFALAVAEQREQWPEQDQRTTRWFSREAAAAAVQEPGLAAIIRDF